MSRRLRLPFVLIATLQAILVGAGSVDAQAGRSQVREGNRLYDEGLFEDAHEKYLEGLAAAPESEVIRFNDGNALYRGEDYERAIEAYRQAAESGDPALESAAWYNLGNALYRQQQLEESLEAFKQSLRLNPSDVDAKHNLERVLEQLQQQQQEQQQEQQQQDQQQSDDQDDQDNQDQQQQQDQQPQDQQDQGDQQQDQQDQQNQQDQQDQQRDPGDQEAQDGQGEPEPEPGEMTEEDARRLLDAIDENSDDVDRRRAPVTGRRPSRPW